MKHQSQTPVSYVGKHTFTAEESDKKLKQMLAAMRQKEEIEAEFKTTKSTYKDKIDAKEAEIKLMSNLLNAGEENMTFQAFLTMDFADGKKYYHEVGSGKLVGTEDLTAADRQAQMDLDEKAIIANNKAADEMQVVIDKKTVHSLIIDNDPLGLKINEEPEYTVEPDANPLEFVPEKTQPQEGGIETAQDDFLFDDPDESNTDEDDPFSF